MAEPAKHISKFTFDTEFCSGSERNSNAARARQRKILTQDEIDQLCTKAHEAGLKSGQTRAAEAIAASLEAMNQTLREAIAVSQDAVEILREDAAHVALAAARKLARIALEAYPESEVEETLRDAIHQAVNEPRITLRAAPSVIEALTPKLEDIAREEGFDGRIHASPDPAVSGSDCRIEWRGGGAERNFEAIDAAIGDIIERRFVKKNVPTSTKG
jgi:flagellar assembly protein FliH